MLEVLDERGAGLVGFAGLGADAGGEIVMLVPTLVVKLDETDAALGQAAGEETVGGEGAGAFAVLPVKLKRAVRLGGQIGCFRHAALHAVGHFILCDARLDLRAQFLLELRLVQRLQFVEQRAASAAAGAIRVGQVENGVLAGTKLDALVA